MARLLLRHADWIYTCDDARRVIQDGYVLIEDGRIAAVGSEPGSAIDADEVVSVAGCVVTPGLVNIHHHLYQTLTRAIPMGMRTDILGWLYAMYPLWAELEGDARYWASLATSCELLASGCTTNADFAYLLPEADGELAAVEIRGVREAGIRFVLVRGGMPTTEAHLEERLRQLMDAQLDRLMDTEDALFAKLEATIARYHDTAPGAMLQVAIGPTPTFAIRGYRRAKWLNVLIANPKGLHYTRQGSVV